MFDKNAPAPPPEKLKRVRIMRTVQGETVIDHELEILVRDSVLDLRARFADELIFSRAAELVADSTKLVTVPLHPPEPAEPAAARAK